ncbi:DNA mismatch repair protein [Halovenus sp. WSH3]|uniref:DNA mismatch repair protein n=1 Tax=Halovenus carboxidivorans TaxID=2692199 RepID=A0A6B0T9D0_9EURY|nr:DNA mismatch repair protein [Halovenus carboxidivorans]MXR51962.1 DNA mismatch repair protein [Halovenus carboxidivorans]
MRLEEYWGIGPKTRDLLVESLGAEAAVEAIEAGDVRALTDAGLPRGRATRILRHAHGGAALDVLATRDARQVYKQLLDIMSEYAVTEGAADRIRILTPLSERAAMADRLDDVQQARESWQSLSEDERSTVVGAFERYDGAENSERGAVEAAQSLRDAGLDSGVFEPLGDLSADALEDAVTALTGLDGDGGVTEGADERLDRLRTQLGAVEDLRAAPETVLEEVQSGARGTDQLQESLAREIAQESGLDVTKVREAMPQEAADARAFVGETLRSLADDLRGGADEREQEVRRELNGMLERARDDIDRAVSAVEEIALSVSLARFAAEFELTEPTFRDGPVAGVVDARNIFLEDAGETVQPITYAVGEHSLSVPGATAPPSGDRVTVLTGANSGGKTTLLETLCQVQLLAQMGLPVPADSAEIHVVERIVFHRRHASFNAGVLESTLRSVVPPLTDSGRTLMLVDEFEAITEPGSAADLLHGLVTLTVEKEALGVFVTHLADDLEPLPAEARTDGIFAEGLTPDLDLEVDYQPRFETVGRSTPEFIVSRLVADASDRGERAGYETLAESVGEQAVQRTLVDAKWME